MCLYKGCYFFYDLNWVLWCFGGFRAFWSSFRDMGEGDQLVIFLLSFSFFFFNGFRRYLQTIDSPFPFLEECVFNLDDHRIAFCGSF